MTPEQNRQIEALFDEAVDLEPSAREILLAAAEAEIAQEVRALLAGLDDPLKIEPAIGPVRLPSAPAAGDVFGAYRLEEKIGEGGFGVVFRATRQVGETRTPVAIKFLKVAFAGQSAFERFELERQVLAKLDHPAIARLLDGGSTEGGVPYLVMEYVQGEPITAYCDRHRLGISQRLALFGRACEAVEYAHRHQFLHRDIKPDNIFITEDGVPKLLDFGITKLLAPGAISLSLPGQNLFTITHASPEQINGEPLTVATDVYSLGVVLYQLLCGRLPFSPKDLGAVAAAYAILKREPTRPSEAVLLRDEVLPESISATRGSRPRTLLRLLAGDLDAIVLTALRKKPVERYPSVDALHLDVDRFLGGWPVEATQPGFGDRARKWMGRNPVAAAIFAVAFFFLARGLVIAEARGFEANRLGDEDRRAVQAAQRMAGAAVLQSFHDDGNLTQQQKEALYQEELRILAREEKLPADVRTEIETERAAAYAELSTHAWELGHREDAEKLVSAALQSVDALLHDNPHDSYLKKLERYCLEHRYNYRIALGRASDAQADRERLLNLEQMDANEKGTRWDPRQN